MKAEELYWSLLNRSDLRQVTGLSFEQARFIVSLIGATDIENWLAWHEGLDKWMALKSFRGLINPMTKAGFASPPLPPPNMTNTADNMLESRSEPAVDKRLNRRFLKNFSVEVVGQDGSSFKTKTVNLSSSGMLLAKQVPDAFGKNFACTLSRIDGSTLKIFCTRVREQNTDEQCRIKFVDVAQPKILLAWLIDSNIE